MKREVVVLALFLFAISGCNVNQPPLSNYKDARKVFWSSVYPSSGQTLYCGLGFDSSRRSGINVEHVFPMSWATKGLNCGTRKQCRASSQRFNIIEADLHNLYPAREDINKARSSFRFGEIRGEIRRFGRDCDFEVSSSESIAEPAPKVRGEVARAMFYMADRYKAEGLVIFKSQARVLLKWHKADPPTEQERLRNDRIELLQGNRNPFIDNPAELTKLAQAGRFF
ncbi:MAG: deoxyribonuclease-1 [Cryomorphaceae bacterium]|jgi:deoxyribonuclease-1